MMDRRALLRHLGALGTGYDLLEIWKAEGTSVSGRALPGGHNLRLDVPDEVLGELLPFLSA